MGIPFRFGFRLRYQCRRVVGLSINGIEEEI